MANFAHRRVTLTAKPGITLEGRIYLEWLYSSAGANGSDIERNVYDGSASAVLATAAGRGCYRSWDVPNEATATPADYLKNILRQKHHCYSEDTDVLTQDGWKSWSEVSMDDKFATLNPEGEIEYHYPTEIIEEHYDGDMIEYVGKGANLMVTPNHKMLACLTTTVAGRKKDKFSLIPADQLVGVSHAMRKDGDFTGGEGTLGESLAWMFGFFAGDGSIQPKWDNQIEFHMSKQRKIPRLTEAVANLGWEMTIRPEKNRKGTAYYAVMVPEHLVETFREFYSEDGQKQIPQRIILQATKAEARAIIQGMVDSDGNVSNESGSGIVFDSSSKTLRDQFMQLALHAGWAANEVEGTTRLAGTVNIINGAEAVLKNDCKRVALLKEWLRPEFNKKATANKASNRVTKYVGKVYCATVPNHTLYVRRNGKPVWSGNSVLEHTSFTFYIENVSRAATHEIVRHRHFGFSQESQRFVLEKRGRDIVCPPLLRENKEAQEWLNNLADEAFDIRDGLVAQIKGERDDLKRKEIVEAARAVLPNAAATSLFMTGNARSWMEFIDKRDSPAADAEIREVAQEIHEQLAEAFPEVFGEEATKLWRGISNQEGVKNDK